MALERRNPLPPGYYWIDVANVKAGGLLAWRKANKAAVRVVKTREDTSLGFTWILFQVSQPTPWADARVYGFPNIAEKGEHEEFQPAFTPSKNVLDQLADGMNQLADGTPSAGAVTKVFWLGALGLGIYGLVQVLKVLKTEKTT